MALPRSSESGRLQDVAEDGHYSVQCRADESRPSHGSGPPPADAGGPRVDFTPSSAQSSLASAAGTNTNKRLNTKGGTNVDPGKRRSLSKVKSPASTRPRPLPLACPFFKKDPRRHWDCASYKANNSKLSHVKQHIYRSHNRPYFCPLCGTEFQDPQLCDAHIRTGCPSPGPFLEPDGITTQQRTDLSRRPSSKLSVEAQWYAVFDIVCPGFPRPPSPYNGPAPEATIAAFQQFITSDEAIQTLSTCLLEDQAWNRRPERPVRLQSIRRGLQRLIDQWPVSRYPVGAGHVDEGVTSSSLPTITSSTPSPSHSEVQNFGLLSRPEPPASSDDNAGDVARQPTPIDYIPAQGLGSLPGLDGSVFSPQQQAIGQDDWATNPQLVPMDWYNNGSFDWS